MKTLHLDAGASPFADGATCTYFSDRSDWNRPALQATAGSRGKMATRGVAGLPGILFDGTDDTYDLQGTVANYFTSTTAAMILVCRPLAIDTNDATIYQNDAVIADDLGYVSLSAKSAPSLTAYWFDGAVKTIAKTVTLGDVVVAAVYVAGGTMYFSVNGGSYGTTSVSALGTMAGHLRLARDGPVGTHYFRGLIAECQLYDSKPSNWDDLVTQALNKYTVSRSGIIEDLRARLALQLRRQRAPTATVSLSVPWRYALGLSLGSRVAAFSDALPSPHATGCGPLPWERFVGTLVRVEHDPESRQSKLTLRDARPMRTSAWYVPGGISSGGSILGLGIPRFLSGQTWTFTRSSPAWVEDLDGTVRVVGVNAEKWARYGHLMEGASTNLLLNSSYAELLTSWTTTGTVAADSTSLMFESGESAYSAKLTADTPLVTGAIIEQTTASVSGLSTTKFVLSVDHLDDTGHGMAWTLQRSSDSKWFVNSTGLWDASEATGTNFFATRTSRARDTSNVIDAGAAAGTLKVRLKATTAAGQILHLYHVQLEEKRWASSRVLTRGATTTRAADSCILAQSSTAEVLANSHGTILIRYRPLFDAASVSGLTFSLFRLQYDGSNEWRLYYDGTTQTFRFLLKRGGASTEAYVSYATTAGREVKVVARWCGSDAEAGLAAYTVSAFADGTKGTDATAAGLPTAVSPANFELGCGASVPCEGYVASFAARYDVLSDGEVAAFD